MIGAQSCSVNGLSQSIDFMVHRGPAHHYQRQAANGQVLAPIQRQSPPPPLPSHTQKPIVNSVCVSKHYIGGGGGTGDGSPLPTPQRKCFSEVALLTHLDLQMTYNSSVYSYRIQQQC